MFDWSTSAWAVLPLPCAFQVVASLKIAIAGEKRSRSRSLCLVDVGVVLLLADRLVAERGVLRAGLALTATAVTFEPLIELDPPCSSDCDWLEDCDCVAVLSCSTSATAVLPLP